jgi:hypothetical protein
LSDTDILALFRIDTTVWYIQRLKINTWEVGAKLPSGHIATEPLYQTTAWLERINGGEAYQRAAEALRARMLSWTPPAYQPIVRTPVLDGHMLEICIADLHLGMRAWAPEAGENYDLKIAERVFYRAIDDLLAITAPFVLDEIVLVLGGDVLHVDQTVDGAGGATSRGTAQDVDDRWPKAFEMAEVMLVKTVERLRQLAPVRIVVVPGNHDLERLFHLGHVLEVWFRADPEVTVNNSPAPRKYLSYGKTLLGYTHKRIKGLGLTMANEAPDDWAATRDGHREWHTAHVHAAALEEEKGVRIRAIPALVANDAWTTEQGYRHLRCAEAFLWHRERTFVGMFSVKARGDP